METERKTYKVNEIFYSLQGEGAYAGTPMVFVRFSGCNLKCSWCDTDHGEHFDMTAEEILEEVHKVSLPGVPIPVCLTGGEPTLQVDHHLLSILEDGKKYGSFFIRRPLHIETNGTNYIESSEIYQCITVSPKTPKPPFLTDSQMFGPSADSIWTELKVVFEDKDMTWLEKLIYRWRELTDWNGLFIQPLARPDGSSNIKAAVEWVKKNPDFRLSVQLHKILQIR